MRRHTHGEDDVQSRRWNRHFKCSRPGGFEPSRPPELLFSAGVMQFHEDDKQEGKKQIRIRSLCGGEDTIHVQVGLTWCRAPWTHTWIMNIMCDGLSWSACACQGNCNNEFSLWILDVLKTTWDAQKITKTRTRWIAHCWHQHRKMIYYKQHLINPQLLLLRLSLFFVGLSLINKCFSSVLLFKHYT